MRQFVPLLLQATWANKWSRDIRQVEVQAAIGGIGSPYTNDMLAMAIRCAPLASQLITMRCTTWGQGQCNRPTLTTPLTGTAKLLIPLLLTERVEVDITTGSHLHLPQRIFYYKARSTNFSCTWSFLMCNILFIYYFDALFSQPFSHNKLAVSSWSPKCWGAALKFDAFRKCHFPFPLSMFSLTDCCFFLNVFFTLALSFESIILFCCCLRKMLSLELGQIARRLSVCSTAADFEANHEKCWYITRAKLLLHLLCQCMHIGKICTHSQTHNSHSTYRQ